MLRKRGRLWCEQAANEQVCRGKKSHHFHPNHWTALPALGCPELPLLTPNLTSLLLPSAHAFPANIILNRGYFDHFYCCPNGSPCWKARSSRGAKAENGRSPFWFCENDFFAVFWAWVFWLIFGWQGGFRILKLPDLFYQNSVPGWGIWVQSPLFAWYPFSGLFAYQVFVKAKLTVDESWTGGANICY